MWLVRQIDLHTQSMHQTSGSELRPRKVELLCACIQKCDYSESLHITMKLVITSTKTSFTTLIFISE